MYPDDKLGETKWPFTRREGEEVDAIISFCERLLTD